MQSMAAAYGARIVRAPTLVHGEASEVTHDGAGLLAGMPPSFMAARYHSLASDPGSLPAGRRGRGRVAGGQAGGRAGAGGGRRVSGGRATTRWRSIPGPSRRSFG